MHLEKITIAQNGFIIKDTYGNLYVAKTLLEAAGIAGESVPNLGYTNYNVGMSAANLQKVRENFHRGNKVEAIKTIRDCFVPRLGLREAKELVENLCG